MLFYTHLLLLLQPSVLWLSIVNFNNDTKPPPKWIFRKFDVSRIRPRLGGLPHLETFTWHNSIPAERVTWSGRLGYPAIIKWTGGLPHLSWLPHLPGVPHLHEKKALSRTKQRQRNVQKSVRHVQICSFANYIYWFCCLSFCHRRLALHDFFFVYKYLVNKSLAFSLGQIYIIIRNR